MNSKKSFVSGNSKTLLAVTVVLAVSLALNIYLTNISAHIALASAYVLVPDIGFASDLRENNMKPNNSSKISVGINDILISDNPDTQSIEVISNRNDSIPSDILELEKQYKQKYANAAQDGKIVEKTYDKKNATSVFGNVTVRNTTASHSINIEKSLNQKANLKITDKSKPTVLIFHTHTTESYLPSADGWYTNSYPTRHDDKKQNMVRVGDAMCEELEKKGIGVIHDTQIYDHKYTGAYDLSRVTVEKILKENPSIQIVLDVHRDAIKQSDGTKIKPTFTYNGRKGAQVMIIAGCEDGKVKSFPNWEQNLTFALQLHKQIETMYPSMMRPILFAGRKYNMDVVPCSVLLEFGSDSNTLAEAEYSGHLVGRALSEYIIKNSEK